MKVVIINPDNLLFFEVMILGKQHSKTLGMFPEGAFRDHARKNMLFAAVDDNTLAGYVLFRITRSRQSVCITHLCIRPEFRSKGVAVLLLNAVKEKYGRLLRGISLRCREDYEAPSRLWERYGFRPIKTVRGRSIEENYLIQWWYDFGNGDLFSQHPDAVNKIQALLDSNIIMKLSDGKRDEGGEAPSLLADWLGDEVEYYYAPEIFNEILRDADRVRADRTRKYLHTLAQARVAPAERDEICLALEKILPGISDNDRSDRKQVADCITAGIDYFVTLDDGLLDASDAVYEQYSLKVLRPADFILAMDQQIHGENYRAYRLAGARHEAAAIEEAELARLVEPPWLDTERGEKKHALIQKLTSAAADPRRAIIKLIKDADATCIGYFAVRYDNQQLSIKAIRTLKGKIAGPLFQQLLREILEIALEKGCDLVINEESCLSAGQLAALTSFGFAFTGNYWYKVLVVGQVAIMPTLQSNDRIKQFLETAPLVEKIQSLSPAERSLFILGLEKQLWPVRFIDLDVPNYVVPIKPNWAGQLFDRYIANTTLFGAAPHLCWSKENVYYRSVKPVSELAPGRILWYVSHDDGDQSGRCKAIVATSYLEEVHIGPAKTLYQKFKNYGIYEWRNIFELAGKEAMKEIKALKFSDTELFQKPLSLRQIAATFQQFGRPSNTFASPVQISSLLFNELYRLAKQ